MKKQTKLLDIKTNLFTGFLGAGKTSAILDLLTQKPVGEKWAVLVNEFGSVGIDGAIYKAKGIEVKEIPGGCMCCVAGVPLQVAVNQILKITRPERLLIEASGLGHPKQVMDTLRGAFYQKVLDIRATICLLDPRNLLDSRYMNHENFIDQIAIADVLVANKTDQCDQEILQIFDEFCTSLIPPKQAIIKTRFGRLDVALLDGLPDDTRQLQHPDHHKYAHVATNPASEFDGYKSTACTFPAERCFDYDKLIDCFEQLMVERLKAVLKTNKGWIVFNCLNQQIKTSKIKQSTDNRVEIIGLAKASQDFLGTKELAKLLGQCFFTD